MINEVGETLRFIKIANIDLHAKKHNYQPILSFYSDRWLSPGISSARDINDKDGFEVQIFQICSCQKDDHLIQDGLRVNFFKGAPSIYPNRKSLNYKLHSRSLEKNIIFYKPDLVHINQSSGKNFVRFCNFLRRKGIPYIVHFRGGDLKMFSDQRQMAFLNAKKLSEDLDAKLRMSSGKRE